jgi:hypothetical protein
MLFVVMIIIGGVTYTLVLNLEHVAQSTYASYKRLRNQVIKPMKEDTAKVWKHRAEKYEASQFLPTDTKLSERWVLWYIILWPFKALIRKIRLVGTRAQAQDSLRWLSHKPKPAQALGNASPPVKDAPDTEDDDWMKTYPKIPISPSPSAPAEGGQATSSRISEHNKRNSGWQSFCSIFTRSAQSGGGIEGEQV